MDIAPVPLPKCNAAFDMLSMDELRSLSLDEVLVALRFTGRTIHQLRADADCVQYRRELERERAERERAQ